MSAAALRKSRWVWGKRSATKRQEKTKARSSLGPCVRRPHRALSVVHIARPLRRIFRPGVGSQGRAGVWRYECAWTRDRTDNNGATREELLIKRYSHTIPWRSTQQKTRSCTVPSSLIAPHAAGVHPAPSPPPPGAVRTASLTSYIALMAAMAPPATSATAASVALGR